MNQKDYSAMFAPETMESLFPVGRSNDFFEAMYGDMNEGAYNITLEYRGKKKDGFLEFCFVLEQRPGKCLVCSLTYGLPEVFVRHPVIGLKKLVGNIAEKIGKDPAETKWELGATREISRTRHEIPMIITIA